MIFAPATGYYGEGSHKTIRARRPPGHEVPPDLPGALRPVLQGLGREVREDLRLLPEVGRADDPGLPALLGPPLRIRTPAVPRLQYIAARPLHLQAQGLPDLRREAQAGLIIPPTETHLRQLARPAGENILTIKELLGHKTLEMTMRYAHLMPDQKKRATMTLEKGFNQG